MPRLPRLCVPGVAQHIIQRGNNRQICFAAEEDFAAYAAWLKEYACKYGVDVHAWVFMTNHVHLLVTPRENLSVSKMMQALGRKYVQYFNLKHGRSGTLWEGRFRSCLVDSENYLLACYRYIELNPVRANIVRHPSEYLWSSFAINALGIESSICTPHESYLALGSNSEERRLAYLALFSNHVDNNLVGEIRRCTQAGLVVGSESFKERIGEIVGRRVEHRPLGRPRKIRL